MSLYPLVPLFSCLVCTALVAALVSRHGGQLAPRLAAAILSCAAFWALCEVLWNVQSDAGHALTLVRLSALGWVWLPPLALHLFADLAGEAGRPGRRFLPAAYAGSGVALAVTWLTPWIHTGVSRASWGWAYHLGPAYPFFYVFTVGCVGAGAFLGWRGARQISSPGERQQAGWVTASVLIPLVVASLTDGLLPLAEVQVPRLGTAAFAALGALVLWSFHRFGYSMLAPGDFARELLEALPDGVAMVRLDGSMRSANGSMARLLEAELDELPGLRLEDRLCEERRTRDAGPERRCELLTLRGQRRPVAVSNEVLRDRQGSPIGLVWVVRDLEEVVALGDRLLLSGRLAAVGQLAAGIAHEIANPLAYVRANLAFVRGHWGALGDVLEKAGGRDAGAELLCEGEEILDETLEGVDRATAIVRDVRGLAHGGRRERGPADLTELLEGVLRLAAPQLRDRVTVERELRPVPLVWGAPQELQQVFLNLLLNASQAVEAGGTIRIVTESADRDWCTWRTTELASTQRSATASSIPSSPPSP